MNFRILCALVLFQIGSGFCSARADDFMALANCEIHAKNPKDVSYAIEQCNRALESGQRAKANLVRVYQSRALAWSYAGQYGRAIDDATSAIKLFPKEASRYITCG